MVSSAGGAGVGVGGLLSSICSAVRLFVLFGRGVEEGTGVVDSNGDVDNEDNEDVDADVGRKFLV